ncbi:hypothetical protein N9165_02220 [Akkermansiaceae bacterium]|nr:hypothetical protein [Akkermansiaceae bacterium]MDB4508032.1 hypothetical protein [Akkermansiaceae bacterium]
MSEEQIPKKKSERKPARKKSALKKAAFNENTEAPKVTEQEQSLPLISDDQPAKVENASHKKEEEPRNEKAEPKKGRVRDTRKNPPSDEKSGDDSEPKKEQEKKADQNSDASNDDSSDDRSEGRGGRNRGRGRGRRGGSGEREPSNPRQPVDGKALKKKAWKIFYSEVTEEGLALLDDKALRAYARGSFNAARIYFEEEMKLDS